MARKKGVPDPEEERGKKILRAIDRLERRKKAPRVLSCLPWLLGLIVVAAIVAVIVGNWDRFSVIWGHLARPDSIPGP